MPDLLAYVNAGIEALSPYEPGKPVEELQRELGIDDVIKLASNENPLGPSPKAREALVAACRQVALYPDGSGFHLKQVLAEAQEIDPARITLGNGSNDLLCLLGQLVLGPGSNAVMAQYAFAIYHLVALGMNAQVKIAAAQTGAMACGHDADALTAAVDDATRILFIANPNNPTGTWLEPAAIESLLERVPARVLVVLDEAYREYQDPASLPDSRTWLERHPNLVVTRTFSKAYGLAGLRVGYAMSSPQVADRLNRVRQAFNVNCLAQAAAIAACADPQHLQRSVDHNRAQLPVLRAGIQALGCDVLPSQANFITLDTGGDGQAVYGALLRAGIIVRPMGGYGLPRHLRVTVGTVAENERFLGALPAALEAGVIP
ncbi:MAG: histidinol-phosphate transaminase [Salinisphaera sp.]|nr:histidinol-phosphate transaminase [Salinisphaera sp.]